MRVLLDENIDRRLSDAIRGHDVSHVHDMGWSSVSNGDLLALARSGFDALVTLDKGIVHQHDHRGQELIIVVVRLPDNRRETQLASMEAIEHALAAAEPGDVIELQS